MRDFSVGWEIEKLDADAVAPTSVADDGRAQDLAVVAWQLELDVEQAAGAEPVERHDEGSSYAEVAELLGGMHPHPVDADPHVSRNRDARFASFVIPHRATGREPTTTRTILAGVRRGPRPRG